MRIAIFYDLNGNAVTIDGATYDPVGNRLSSAGVPSYSYNPSNELASSSSVTYGYDNNGNTTSKTDSTGTTNYAWDFQNRLTSVTLPGSGGTVSFVYDPFGRRIKKLSSAGASIYDVNNLVEETNSSGAVVSLYAQGEDVDEPLAMLRSSTTSYYHVDGLGTVTSLSTGAGALAQTYTFDSFGKQTARSGSLTSPFQYTGRELDTETGLYFYRARYFDPTIGRFLGEDPVHNHLYKSFYSYVFNSPVNATDPTGKRTRVCCRPVNNITGRLGQYHCSIAIDGNPGINGGGLGTFSLFPANYSIANDTGIGVPHSNDPTDFGPVQNGTASCKDVPDCTPCKEQKILENQGYGGDPGPSYNYHASWRGQVNSNSYVSYALKKAGCTPPKLDVSAPGY